MNIEELKYPIGKFERPAEITPEKIEEWIGEIEALPKQLKDCVANLTEEQLDTPYRPEGWTVRQVIHHIADSHMNSYIRFKWTATEDNPTIKAYDQVAWGDLPDSKTAPVELSLAIIEGLHLRWVTLLKTYTEADWKRTMFHPESKKTIPMDVNLPMYGWHGKHHIAHIEALKKRESWS